MHIQISALHFSIIPIKTDYRATVIQPNKFPNEIFLFFTYDNFFFCIVHLILPLAILTYSFLLSHPMKLRFSRIAAIPVVPDPINGSNTIPPLGVLVNFKRYLIRDKGFTVGWLFGFSGFFILLLLGPYFLGSHLQALVVLRKNFPHIAHLVSRPEYFLVFTLDTKPSNPPLRSLLVALEQ